MAGFCRRRQRNFRADADCAVKKKVYAIVVPVVSQVSYLAQTRHRRAVILVFC
jgi:hypothetical protein